MATKRVQTPRQQPNQVRLQPQASVVDTFVRPARNDQISKALDSVTGNVKRVEVKEERKLDMIQVSKKQAAQNSFNIGLKSIMEQEVNARKTGELLKETPEFKELAEATLSQVDDPVYKEQLANSIDQMVNATSKASSEGWQRLDLKNAGSSLLSDTVDLKMGELEGSTPEEIQNSLNFMLKDMETILKDNNGFSNTDIQSALLAEQERRGELFGDTYIGDYALESGFGGPAFTNKMIALNSVANANDLSKRQKAATLDLINYQDKAAAGNYTAEDNEAAFAMYDLGLFTENQYMSLGKTQNAALVSQNDLAIKQQASTRAVAVIIAGGEPEEEVVYTDSKGSHTLSRAELDREAAMQIKEDSGGDFTKEVSAYSRANLVNSSWKVEATQTFKELGAGNLVHAAKGMDKLMKIYAANPRMISQYITNAKDLTAFKEFQILKEAYPTPTDALQAIITSRDSGLQPNPAEIELATAEVISKMDSWFDGVSDDDFRNMFTGSVRQYIRTIAKHSGLKPEHIAEHYAEEIKNDHSLVNGFLVFTGNLNVDRLEFTKDAELHISRMIAANGGYEEGQLSLQPTGRGNTFRYVGQNLRTPFSGPYSKLVHLDDLEGLSATQTLTEKTNKANRKKESQVNRKKQKSAR